MGNDANDVTGDFSITPSMQNWLSVTIPIIKACITKDDIGLFL